LFYARDTRPRGRTPLFWLELSMVVGVPEIGPPRVPCYW